MGSSDVVTVRRQREKKGRSEMRGVLTGAGGRCGAEVHGLVACCNQVFTHSDSSALVYRGL